MNNESAVNVELVNMSKLKKQFSAIAAILFAFANHGFAIGQKQYIETGKSPGAFSLVENGNAADIFAGAEDFPGVIRAAHDLQKDIRRVSGANAEFISAPAAAKKNAILIGTIGKSELIDRLIREKKIDVSQITNQWESFLIQVVPKPVAGIENALVIAGSDKRGTIYGIYDVSEQIGVSPWYYWADVPPQHHPQLFVKPGRYVQGPPSVKYRGIFLNDEAPDLSGWIQEKFGSAPGYKGAANYGPAFYTNLFEVILRCKGNYLWPAMWNNAFNEDDTNNPRLADEYGIVMGTSHQEPMMRAQKEWDRNLGRKYGSWNYAKIPDVVSNFWREGIQRNKDYENLVTIGLRGANDTPMAPGGPEANMKLLEKIVAAQRDILSQIVNPDVTKVPQVWCLYKEVMDFYKAGMRVPDDVTLLWAEDNWGNVRRLPTAAERKRSGGAGIYYHFDYHGGPRSYQWINANPISKIWDQMSLAKEYGADKVWIVNVGHFKGYELPMQYFLDLGWNSDRWTNDNIDEYTRLWAAQQFGPEYANDIADILSKYTKYNGRRKPELVDARTYSLVDYNEFENVVNDFNDIAQKAREISDKLPEEKRAAFYELVLFPTKASAQLNEMYLAAAKNNLYARQGRAGANDFAEQTRALFAAETNLMHYFNHDFLDGKWDHFMDQTVIGYRSWNDPRRNNMSAIRLAEVDVPDAAAMGVAVENSESAATNGDVTLPQFDAFNRQKFYIDVFNKGKTAFDFTASTSEPWIVLNETSGSVRKDKRLWASVDWNKAPKNSADGTIKISGANSEVTVHVRAFNPTEITRDSLQGFVEGDGYVSIEPEHYTRKTDAGKNRWIKIQDYGRTLSGMRTTGEPNAPAATPGKDSPSLEYKMYLFNVKTTEVVAVTSPVLNFMPDRGIRYAVSFDDETPQIVTLVPKDYNAQNGNRDWEESVKNNSRIGKSIHTLDKPGYHTLKFWMIDPGVVLQKIVVNTGGVKPSYLGPPESFHVASRGR
ncbi:MAG TPA: glycosyl hydrolase 115 family protein [Verrucomicrobiae bacterium]|nr:glycosyl hydrolase 115 family protein [Verrucomicrobiae bacterium]